MATEYYLLLWNLYTCLNHSPIVTHTTHGFKVTHINGLPLGLRWFSVWVGHHIEINATYSYLTEGAMYMYRFEPLKLVHQNEGPKTMDTVLSPIMVSQYEVKLQLTIPLMKEPQ